jgi:hypothetical protein
MIGNKFKCIVMLGSLLFLAGCETGPELGREKSGGTVQEFTNTRFQCLQQASGRVSSANVNNQGGQYRSGTGCSQNLYDACMQSKGWFVIPGGRFTQPSGCQ